jgi:hypothetical protein
MSNVSFLCFERVNVSESYLTKCMHVSILAQVIFSIKWGPFVID